MIDLTWYSAVTKLRSVAERDALLTRARKELSDQDYEDFVEITLTSWALRRAGRR